MAAPELRGRAPKPVLVVHPTAATRPVKDALRRAGYAVVVGLPEHFHALEILPDAATDILYRAALKAIKDTGFSSVRDAFAHNVEESVRAIAGVATKLKTKAAP